MPRWWSGRGSQGLAPPPTRTHNSASGCVFSAPAELVMPASADEENRSATADPLARTVADVLVRNALPGEIDSLEKDRRNATAARSRELRAGKECVSTRRSRRSTSA